MAAHRGLYKPKFRKDGKRPKCELEWEKGCNERQQSDVSLFIPGKSHILP